MIRILDVIKRVDTGPFCKEHDFDLKIASKLSELLKGYDIKYDPKQPIPTNNDLVDDAFRAALDLFLDVGVLCIDNSRLIKFEEEEVKEALRDAPKTVTFGEGSDSATMRKRDVMDREPPFCLFTAVGTPVSEDIFPSVMRSYAQEPLADTFSGPSLQSFRGMKIKSGTPLEVLASIWNAIWTREAAMAAGRPDLGCHNVIACAEKTAAIIAANRPEFGVRKTDGFLVAALGEMKIDYERLNKATYLLEAGNILGGLYGPIMGGYAGGPEGTAIVTIAHHFLGLLIYQAEWHLYFPIHIYQNCNTTREMLWLISLTAQALSRNTHLLHSANEFMAAGPCTEMIIHELAAFSTVATVSGAHLDVAAAARNKYPEHCSGMEARMSAEIGHIVAEVGMKREDANEIVQKLLAKYEDNLLKAPIGKSFRECYDITTVTPSKEYLKLYDKSKKELEDIGFDFSLLSFP